MWIVRHSGKGEGSKREIWRKPGSVVAKTDWSDSSKGKLITTHQKDG